MTMTQQYAEMLRRYAATMDGNLQPAKAEAVRQAARHMEELQSRLDATPEGYGSVPAGYALVPLEPDDALARAVEDAAITPGTWADTYRMIVAAATAKDAKP